MNTEKKGRGRPAIPDDIRNQVVSMRKKGFSFDLISRLLCISVGSAYSIAGHIKTEEKRGSMPRRSAEQAQARAEVKARAQKARQERQERLEVILSMRSEGATIYSIAKAVGVTHQRVSQILKAQKP